MKNTDSLQKGLVLATLFILLAAAPIQAMISTPQGSQTPRPAAPFNPPATVWQDTFDNATYIDPSPPGSGATDNYLISSGHAAMAGTCPAWTDTSWTKMKPINLTNSGAAKTNYVLRVTVAYDSDMQSTFNDIRFKHSSNPTTYCSYWIEYKNTTTAIVWVKILNVPAGASTLYLFYGNTGAPAVSSYANTFGTFWTQKFSSDEQISNQPGSQNAVDPDVTYGNNNFLVAWEEGTTGTPWYRGIEGQILDINGSVTVPTFVIKEKPGDTYIYSKPATAFGGSNFMVAYSNYTGFLFPPSSQDLEAEIVHQDGSIGARISVCTQTERQENPNVAFDPNLNRFSIIWTDARLGTTNYNLYAHQYATDGSSASSEKTVVSTTTSQTRPWLAFDTVHNHYLVVWEDSSDPVNGPFSIYAQLFNATFTSIGSAWVVASGTTSVDNIWPTAIFNTMTQRFIITWNTGDISSSNYYGNIYARLYDYQGNPVGSQITIASGSYHDPIVQPYLTASFLLTYNNATQLFSRLIGPSGELTLSSQFRASSTSAVTPNTPSTAVVNKRLFTAWEDNRQSGTYQYVYANINSLTNLSTDTDLSYVTGTEQSLILTAHITSIAITPSIITSWNLFNAVYSGTVTFSILDGTTGAILLASVTPGTSLTSLSATSVRLKATLTRTNPSTSPYVDKWNVSWITNRKPNTPANPYPTNGTTFQNPTVLLSWTGGDPDGDTTTYDIYLGTTTTPPRIANNQSATSYDPGTLQFGQTYYWRIISWDPYGFSTTGPLWHFTTDAYPLIPSNPTPANHTGGINITQDISWTGGDPDSGDSVVYDVYLGTTNPPPLVSNHQYDTTFDPGVLVYLSNYYWRIIAIDSYGATTTGPLWNFTTVYAPNHPPYAPTSPTPANESINISTITNLSWTGGDPDPVDTITYDVYFGTTNPPPLVQTSDHNTTYSPGTLQYLTTYYWQIISWDNRGASTSGPIWQFTTAQEINYPPYLPSDPNPGPHATNVNINADLSWTCGDPNPHDTLTFDVYFGTTNPPSCVVHNQTTTTYDPGEMEYLTQYYWQIVAWDNHGASTHSYQWDFTTEAEVEYPPIEPNTPSPANGTTNVTTTPTLTWTSGDPNPHDVVTYDVYFGNTTNPPLVSNNQTAMQYSPGRLPYLQTCYWRIVAWDNHGVSTSGPKWVFTVMPVPPDVIPPTVTLVKPERAIYIKNVKVSNFITAVVFGFIDVEVNASDSESGIAKVVFSVDGVPKATTSMAPYTWRWAEAGFFFYTLTVTGYDNAGNHRDVTLRVWKFM